MKEKNTAAGRSRQSSNEELLSFSPYAQRKTGISQSGTYVRVDDYYLISVLFKLSAQQIFLLVSLNESEITFFQKYQGTHCSVYLSYHNGTRNTTTKILVPTSLGRISQVPGRRNICVLQFSIKNCPEILAHLLGGFSAHMHKLQSDFTSLSRRTVMLHSPAVSRRLGFNDYAEALIAEKEIPVRVHSFSVDSIVILVSVVHEAVQGQKKFPLKLYFRQSRFRVNATVTETSSYGNIYVQLALSVNFSPELVEILSTYFEYEHTGRIADTSGGETEYDYEELEAL